MLDTSASLKDQVYSAATEDSPAVTWYDYFMDQTIESVKSLLYYCEEADALGITLNEDELAEIEAALDSIATTASLYGYTTNAYISNMYGGGVQKSDVRNAMKLSALANKCMTHISEDLEGKITEERIDSTYDKDKKSYNVIDYTYYTFSVTYKDIAKEVLGADYTESELSANKDKVVEAYKKAIQDANDKANALKSEEAVDAAAFLKEILTHSATKEFDTAYGAKTITEKPSEADCKTIKDALIAEVVTEVIEGKDSAADAAKEQKAYGVSVSEAYAKVINEVKKTVFTKVSALKKSNVVDKATYSSSSDFSKWAFDEGRGAGDTTVIATGDGSKKDDTFATPSSASVTVYLLRTPQRADETKSRNVSYILFTTKKAAEDAIGELSKIESLTKDAFEEYAEGCSTAAGHNTLEDYTEGALGSDVFDEWVFGIKTLPGTVTTEPLTLSEGSYVVAYYAGEGTVTWRVTVKSSILDKDYEAYYTDMTAKYESTIKVQESLDNVVDA